MNETPAYESIRTTKSYDHLINVSYARVKRKVEEIALPAIRVLTAAGNEPPASPQYQEAIAVLYGIGYTLKMGLKYGKLPKPKGYFDYRVGALETLWWSTGKKIAIDDPKTLRWQAFLMVPPFVSRELVGEARRQAAAKRPETPYERAALEAVEESRAVQVLHVGPYDREEAAIELLHQYIAARGLKVAGKHHEIYISDPRRTAPEKLKTVIRLPVEPR